MTSKTSISPEPKRLTGRFAAILQRYFVTYCNGVDDEDFIFCWLTTQGKRPAGYRQTPMSGMTIDRIYQRAQQILDIKCDSVTKSSAQRSLWSGHSALYKMVIPQGSVSLN